jgi:hypothetical protein
MKALASAILLLILHAPAGAQSPPPVGVIDFYGLRATTEQQARAALRIKVGDDTEPLMSGAAREEAERRLTALLPNVVQARLSFTCCEAGRMIVYVGVRERGEPALEFRAAPKGAVRLPDAMVRAGEELESAIEEAVLKGDAVEDDSRGYALLNYPKARAIQERFVAFAAQDLPRLRAVLRDASDASQRSLAVEIIAYSARKREVVRDLVYALDDPDAGVRNDAMRALAVLAVFARNSPGQRIKIPVRPFVRMLNSIVWTDRNKSALALNQLTATRRDPAIIASLRRSALPSLVEMARWKSPGHAGPAFTLLGRAGNFSEAEIQRAWQSGDRESLIKAVLQRVGPREKAGDSVALTNRAGAGQNHPR